MLAYGLQDATVPSRWDGFSRVGALEVQTKIAYVPQDATVRSRWDGFSRVGALEVQPHQFDIFLFQ